MKKILSIVLSLLIIPCMTVNVLADDELGALETQQPVAEDVQETEEATPEEEAAPAEVVTEDEATVAEEDEAPVDVEVEAEPVNAKGVVVSGKCGDDMTWTLGSDHVLTISGTGCMDNYASWENYGQYIYKVVINQGVETIGDYAFEDCSNLKSVSIPGSVVYIGDSAFEDCDAITSINIPDGVQEIGYDAFYGCDKLASVTIPSSVQEIGYGAFSKCTNLTTVKMPEHVSYIGRGAFAECYKLTDITLPEEYSSDSDIKDILYCTPVYIKAMHGVSGGYDNILWAIDENMTMTIYGSGELGEGFARSCDYCHVAKKLVIDSGITSLGGYAIDDFDNVTSVILPKTLKTIKECAFLGCPNLKSITIPSSVTKIERMAFYTSCGIKTLYIPSSVKTLGSFQCEKTVKYKTTTKLTKLTRKSKAFTAKWSKKSDVSGYQIRYSLKSSMSGAKKVTVSKAGTTSKTIKKLKKKKKYYVQVRTYKNVKNEYGDTYKIYSNWSSKKSIKTK